MKKSDLVGSWKLLGYGPSGAPPASRVAPAHDGLLIYSPDGHVSVSMARTDGYWGYCGTYDVEGDIVIHRSNVTFYFPLVTCIIVSIVVSVVFWLLSR